MKERPILFSAPMVRAILEGRKTQTRRLLKCDGEEISSIATTEQWAATMAGSGCFSPTPSDEQIQNKAQKLRGVLHPFFNANGRLFGLFCPYGQPGDRLWVRETWAESAGGNGIVYRADMTQLPKQRDSEVQAIFAQHCRMPEAALKWKPSIHLPRRYSRILLEISDIRVERLKDISDADAEAEGTSGGHGAIPGYGYAATPGEHYHWLWDSINGAGSWQANPWVWVVGFKRVLDETYPGETS